MPAGNSNKALILAVDDSEDDLLFLEIVAKEIIPAIELRSLRSGEQAISYILGRGIYSDRTAHPMPAVMLLDLKMTCVSGFDVLAAISELEVLKRPSICILSSSLLDNDINKAKALGADAFHTKPNDLRSLTELLQNIATSYCPTHCVLPNAQPAACRVGD